ncbi:FtsX-like permease family protein [Candidatus Enterococcus ikei]|uniref:ABC transporter permease n=1 Tax=Candidatus Enterococcus ikei TaxID=2815326 RepID=A0ABS3H219_9ENTE|nr:ABC transporter permease [Enterococcus sp. DIV0869a]
MNFIKRALLSVTRKKGKSLILFAVIFVLGNVIAGSIAIQQSTQNVEKSVKKQLGGMATIQLDYENNQEEFGKEDLKIDWLKVDLMKKIGESSYVKYYDYNANNMIQTKDLKSVSLDSEQSGGMMEGFTLKGSNYNKILDVEENKIKVVDGKVFTQDDIDNGKNVGLISSKVAEENGLSVGDQMIMDSRGYDYSENGDEKELFKIDVPIQIIGIFEPTTVEMKDKDNKKNESQNPNEQFMSLQQLNTVYLTNKSVLEFNKNYTDKFKEVDPNSPLISEDEPEAYYTPVYVLKSPDDVEAFKQETQPLLPKLYTVQASTDQYEQIGGSMKKMSKISGYVVLIAVIATLLIISLVVLLFMRDRKHELGIYLSLGDKRSHVMGQIIIEMLIISGIALIISLITGNLLGKMVSESLLNSDMLSSANDQMNMFMAFDGLGSSDLTADDIMNAYEVKFSLGYIVTYLIVGLGTVLLSAILPLLYIVRLNPKKIMM